MDARTLLQIADVTLEGALDIPCELRLQHKVTKKFIAISITGDSPEFVDRWQDATYFSSLIENDEENTFEFQWEWNRKECEQRWMDTADKNDYRLHIVIGDSE